MNRYLMSSGMFDRCVMGPWPLIDVVLLYMMSTIIETRRNNLIGTRPRGAICAGIWGGFGIGAWGIVYGTCLFWGGALWGWQIPI